MTVALLEKTAQRKWKVWAFCTLVLLVVYVTYPRISPFCPSPTERKTNLLWWETDDCESESPACGSPLATYRGTVEGKAGGTCGLRAWAAGPGQRVLSFSLFGNNSEYWKGLDTLLSEVEKLYPEWKVRLYTNPRGRASVLCPLLHRYPSLLFVCDITNIPPPLGNLSGINPMVWRVAPLGDPQVTTMAVRDTDSQVSEREVAAVHEWLASGKAFHVMRDHPYHTMPVMGGMWGARWDNTTGTKMATLRNKMISLATGKGYYGHDQKVIKAVLWPVMTGRVVAHDSYHCQGFKGSSPWPTRRAGNQFVGKPRFRKKYENSSIPNPCPKACRPPAHRDWLYC